MNIGDRPETDAIMAVFEQVLAESANKPLREDTIAKDFQTRLKSLVDDADEEQLANSVQARGRNQWGLGYLESGIANSQFWRQRTETDIAPYGYYARDLQMRRMFTLQGNDLIQAATAAMVQKVQSCEWTIEGPSRTANAAQDMIRNSDLGSGWETYVSKTVQDWLTQDNGMFSEVIWNDGSQDDYILDAPSKNAQIIGVAHLDASRCRRTGNFEHPVIYQALNGTLHRMHKSRVLFAADMPSPNERLLGRGFCAFSRALSMAQTVIRYSTYRTELLDDVPALGLLILQNINQAFWNKTNKEFQSQRSSNEQYFYSNLMTLFNADPTKPADAKILPFKQLWEGFDESAFFNLAIDMVAMSFGIDRQELAPLTTSAMGSGAQSTVLNAKARGKGIGNILTTIERQINQLVPASCTFTFDYHDESEDAQYTQTRDAKAKTIIQLYDTATKAPTSMAGVPGAQATPGEAPLAAQTTTNDDRLISKDEARRLLALEIPEWAEIITAPTPDGEVQYDDSDDEPLNPQNTGLPAPAIAKMVARYGPQVRIHKSGKVQIARVATPISREDRAIALEFLKTFKVLA